MQCYTGSVLHTDALQTAEQIYPPIKASAAGTSQFCFNLHALQGHAQATYVIPAFTGQNSMLQMNKPDIPPRRILSSKPKTAYLVGTRQDKLTETQS